MRILHIVSAIDPLRGGPITALLGLVPAQRAAGLDVSVVATYLADESPAAADDLRRQGANVEMIGPAVSPLRWHRGIKPALRELIPRADVVHVHALWEEINHRATVVCRGAGVPYLVTPHGMLTRWSMGQSRLKKQLYLKIRMRRDLDAADAVHYTTEAERDASLDVAPKVRSIVEPLGVDLSEFETLPEPGTFRRRFPQVGARPLVVFLGRVHPGKGLELLVPAVAQVPGDAMLVIVGPDSEGFRTRVEEMIRQHGIGDRVLFTGMLRGRDRVAALADATLFALPSFHENFGVAVIEALACGVPVIISDGVNIHREISAAGVGGVVPLAVDPLAAELTRWLGDAALRESAAARARSFVREHYDWSRIARRWVDHYEALAGPRGGAARAATAG